MTRRVTCVECRLSEANYRERCRPCYNAGQRRRRRERVEEGRCSWCGRVVLDVKPATGDLYSNCKKCRIKRSRTPSPHAATLAEYMRKKSIDVTPAFARAEGAENFVTVSEASRLAGMTYKQVDRDVRKGRLPHVREFGKTWINARELRPKAAAAAAA